MVKEPETADEITALRAKEWSFCPVHEIVVHGGWCCRCKGDRNLIQVGWVDRVAGGTWEEKRDEWDKEIRAAFPTRSGSHDEYGVAMRMVGNRHDKASLIALVNWLLVKCRDAGAAVR
jgi:hypothetical protein